ncbi:hypothetical protein GCM10009717_07770 [Agromyces allii]|uniref:Uncharacterized protein n=1 Tax=Agromyces allii TaxID=393607 RepID=A0ABP5BH16_9MICO
MGRSTLSQVGTRPDRVVGGADSFITLDATRAPRAPASVERLNVERVTVAAAEDRRRARDQSAATP